MTTLRMSLLCVSSLLAGCVGDDPSIAATAPSNLEAGNGTDGDGATSGEASSGSPKPGTPADSAVSLRVQAVRNPAAPDHPAYGSWVEVKDLVVTGIKSTGTTHGFFVQDAPSPSWGGIYVYVGYQTVQVQPGDVVRVRGEYKAFRGFDEIEVWNGGEVAVTGSATVPDPVPVSVGDIMQGGLRAKELQSVRLVVKNVVATSATNGTDFRVAANGATTPELFVTSYMANDVGASPFPAVSGQQWAEIRGFGYSSGSSDQTAVAKLAPASAADLDAVTP
jgi:hypothetical protein